jgi:hypothetical protein
VHGRNSLPVPVAIRFDPGPGGGGGEYARCTHPQSDPLTDAQRAVMKAVAEAVVAS